MKLGKIVESGGEATCLMVKSLHIMNFKGGSKSHGSNAHEIWTRGSTFHGGPFLMVDLQQEQLMVSSHRLVLDCSE